MDINHLCVEESFELMGGTAGYVLTSDSNGVGTWQKQSGPSTTELSISSTTIIDAQSYQFISYTASTSLTSFTFSYSNFIDGGSVDIDLLKTQAATTSVTFPINTIISYSSSATISGITASLVSTSSGRFNFTIKRYGSIYKVWITQDIL